MKAFQEMIWSYYNEHKRDFVWRKNITPYVVVVSEIMLQQTQTSRVKEKIESFVKVFPSFEILAQASTLEVIKEWVGLGYNRRALTVHEFAKKVVTEWGGIMPKDPLLLQTCKGIGPATAASIIAFAFNQPTIFIETNIRTVFLHHFFKDETLVPDAYLFPFIKATLDHNNPREWYYALMDYGVMIKKNYKNPNRKSKHYVTQSRFEGSDRQIRGAVLRLLLKEKIVLDQKLFALDEDKNRMQKIVDSLIKEGFIICDDHHFFSLSK